ncbi:class D sortase [Shewanella sp. JM162201]|uniref:Class D sortase n=1 Tax=Shewanella jiangmenensis TaxID=2837387 RepID=A0ABS5V6L7_9GAMM|nr:class D sortase [Shewanella jiangmenensis]MBT1445472.1 class D sortase [Shewanella jiangmenensis]
MQSPSFPFVLKCAGIACLSVFALAKLHQVVAGEQALMALDAELAARASDNLKASDSNLATKDERDAPAAAFSAATSADTAAGRPAISRSSPDMSDWSDARKRAWREEGAPSVLLGKLTIDALDVEAALFNGDSELHLNKGVARVDGTGTLGGDGNLVIAGHRDSFFRKLGSLKAGDEIRIVGADGREYRYQMTQHWIVTPADTWVMAEVSDPVLTLITCYPFYFVGSAPKRYIVRAKRL